MNTLGNEIEAACIQQSYSFKDVAHNVNISPQYLSDIIHNHRTPSDKVLSGLIVALHLNRNYAYYLLHKYPPELRGLDIPLPILDKTLAWLQNPYTYTLRKTSY